MTSKHVNSLVPLYIWIARNRTGKVIIMILSYIFTEYTINKYITIFKIESHTPILWFPYPQGVWIPLVKNPWSRVCKTCMYGQE